MKGVLRSPGTFTWCYNNTTDTKLLLKSTSPLPAGFVKGCRGPDLKQKDTVVAYNIITNKEKKFKSISDIPDGWIQGRPGGTTSGTIWIYNILTNETKLIKTDEIIPEGWKLGNKNIKNSGRIHIFKEYPNLIRKSINPDLLEEFLNSGWKLGSPEMTQCPIFKLEGNIIVSQLKVKKSELNSYLNNGWYKGLPVYVTMWFNNGDILTYPKQWFIAHKNITSDKIFSTLNTKKFINCDFFHIESVIIDTNILDLK